MTSPNIPVTLPPACDRCDELLSNALDATMNTSPNWGEFRAEIRANRPLVSFIPGHSRTVAGYTRTVLSWYSPQRGLVEYYVDIGGRTQLPMLIYHIPGRAAVNVEAATIERIAERIGEIGAAAGAGKEHQRKGVVRLTDIVECQYGAVGIKAKTIERINLSVKDGVLVVSVETDSPAARAGIKAGDVITAVNGQNVASRGDLVRSIQSVRAEADLTIDIMREKKETSVTAKLENTRAMRRPPAQMRSAPRTSRSASRAGGSTSTSRSRHPT